MDTIGTGERRQGDRRRITMTLGERGMRCRTCGARWFSAIAAVTAQWAQCAACGGRLHAERRGGDRRGARTWAAGERPVRWRPRAAP